MRLIDRLRHAFDAIISAVCQTQDSPRGGPETCFSLNDTFFGMSGTPFAIVGASREAIGNFPKRTSSKDYVERSAFDYPAFANLDSDRKKFAKPAPNCPVRNLNAHLDSELLRVLRQ
jgi:hypothetical protein